MLRRKVLSKILIIEGAILASFILAFYLIFDNYQQLEREDLEKSLVRVQNAINREMNNLIRYNLLWARDGAIYYAIRNNEPMSIAMRDMSMNSIVGAFDIEAAAIYNAQQELLIAKKRNPNSFIDTAIERTHPIVQMFEKKGLMSEENLPAHGLAEYDGLLIFINSQIIRNPLEPEKFLGAHVITRNFGQDVIDELVEVVQQEMDIMTVSQFLNQEQGPALLKAMQDADGKPLYKEIDHKTMGTYQLMPDISGDKNLVIVLRTPRSIILQAKQGLTNIGIALLVFFLVRVMYVLKFLDKSILIRLKNLTTNIDRLTVIEEPSERLIVDGKDEISHLTASFNSLLDALEKSQTNLRNERDKAEITLDSIGDAVITTDLASKVTYMNKAAQNILSDRANSYQHQPIELVFCPTDDSGLCDVINLSQHCIEAGESIRENNYCHLINGDGETIVIESLACPIYDYSTNNSKNLKGVVIVFRDVSHAKKLQQNLIYQASHDGLTNLYNRSEFERQLSIVAKSAHKNHQNHHLIFIDLDRFKIVNDVCGHIAGDKVLREIAHLMQSLVRKSDILARIGGDEFAVILMDCKFPHAYEVADKIREAIANFRFIYHDNCFSFGASVGFVNLKDHTYNSDTDLLSMADKACMAAKNSGRNRIHVYRKEDTQVIEHREQTLWVNRITDALEHDHFELYFQRIAASKQSPGHKRSAEILLRMIGSDKTVITPGAFLPAAERYGLMKFIDKWVIETFCRWASSNPSIFREINLFSINLSGQSLSDAEFLNYLVNYFSVPLVQPKYICFEITETSAIQNIANARKFINRLKDMGFSFSLDDFGSGMSSFSYLKHLAVDTLKIDGAFIRNIEKEAIDYSMVRSINEIGHILGVKTVAEYVESEVICAMVKKLGVDYMQGYHIHKPTPLSSLIVSDKKLSNL